MSGEKDNTRHFKTGRFTMILTARKVSIAITINRLIRFGQKLPWIGRRIPDSLYGHQDSKTILLILANLYRLIRRLMFKALYIALLVAFSFTAMEINEQPTGSFNLDAVLTLFFFLSFITAPLVYSKALNLDIGTDLMMVDQLRADAHTYVPARIYERKIIDFGATLPFAILLSLHEAFTLPQALLILLLQAGMKLIGESFILVSFSLLRRRLVNAYKILSYSLIGLGLIVSLIPMIMISLKIYLPFQSIVFHPFFVAAVLITSVISIRCIQRYRHYRELAWGTVVHYHLALEKIKPKQKKQLFGNADQWNKNLDAETLRSDRFAGLTGYAYINQLFFYRHRRFFRKKILLRTAIAGLAVLGLSVILLLTGPPPDVDLTGQTFMLPLCFFFAYLLSLGRAATAAMFANCDAAMLVYPFYRSPSVVIENFYLRLRKIMWYNAPAFSLLALFAITGDLLGVLYQSGDPSRVHWVMILPYLLTVMMMWLFFSFHDLFIYYILQPYTSELGTKSKLFSIIQFAVYMLSYLNIMLSDVQITTYMMIVTALTLLYVALGLVSINKFCWKTFRLK